LPIRTTSARLALRRRRRRHTRHRSRAEAENEGRGDAEDGWQHAALYVPHDPLASLDATAKVKLLERLESMRGPKIRASRKSWRTSPASTKSFWWRGATAGWRPISGRWCASRSRSS
jgi:hypothetical protein